MSTLLWLVTRKRVNKFLSEYVNISHYLTYQFTIIYEMKRKYFTVAVVLLSAGALFNSSCIGSFALSNKLLSWNKQVGNKFVNELVFFSFWILPVYEVSMLADVLVLNSIEFWSGNNPVAEGRSIIEGEDGRYIVDCDASGYTITSENDGSQVRLDFDTEEQSWSMTTGDETYPLFTFVDDSHVAMPAPDGTTTIVELSRQGVLAYEELVQHAPALAFR